jgi:hypothetical protein
VELVVLSGAKDLLLKMQESRFSCCDMGLRVKIRYFSPMKSPRFHFISGCLLATLACASASGPAHHPMAEVTGETHTIGAPGLRYVDVQTGEGAPLTRGKCAYVHYDLYRTNGVFVESSRDSSRGKPGDPIAFPMGAGKVIRGWDLGLEGMKMGGVRRLYVPEDLAYGAAGSPPLIPASVGLIFDVQLLYITESRNSTCLPWRALQP